MVATDCSPRQPSLFATGAPTPAAAPVERIQLSHRSWIDWAPGWLAGADSLCDWCREHLRWRTGERVMYERIVAEPRLTASLPVGGNDTLVAIAGALGRRHGRPFGHVFANLYRSGHDSVAWHGDREGRRGGHTVVPVLSLGGPRTFALRPRGGGPARRFEMYSGDLLVMGGACQHEFEHAVPKRARAQPRISLTFRHRRPDQPLTVRSVASATS